MSRSQKILIIGGTSDVAIELAAILSKSGIDLILTKRIDEELEPVKKDLMIRYGTNVQICDLEATDYQQHEDILLPYLRGVDDVFCFIGYNGDQEKAQQKWSESEMIIDVNYKGLVSILNIVANVLEERKTGSIVTVSSVAGNRGRQSNYLYGSAKAGLTAYLSGLRNRLCKNGVHVTTILPGFMMTKMTEHLDLPGMLTATPQQAATRIYKSYLKKKNVVYILPIWRYIMLIIVNIPEFIFKKLSL